MYPTYIVCLFDNYIQSEIKEYKFIGIHKLTYKIYKGSTIYAVTMQSLSRVWINGIKKFFIGVVG